MSARAHRSFRRLRLFHSTQFVPERRHDSPTRLRHSDDTEPRRRLRASVPPRCAAGAERAAASDQSPPTPDDSSPAQRPDGVSQERRSPACIMARW